MRFNLNTFDADIKKLYGDFLDEVKSSNKFKNYNYFKTASFNAYKLFLKYLNRYSLDISSILSMRYDDFARFTRFLENEFGNNYNRVSNMRSVWAHFYRFIIKKYDLTDKYSLFVNRRVYNNDHDFDGGSYNPF